jgi:hypothetical protein
MRIPPKGALLSSQPPRPKTYSRLNRLNIVSDFADTGIQARERRMKLAGFPVKAGLGDPPPLSAGVAMHLVVVHVAESDEILDGVFAFVLVMLLVVQLKHFAGIVR